MTPDLPAAGGVGPPARTEVRGRRVVVMGLGRFGGGAGTAAWLAAHGAEVLVTDLATPEALRDTVATIGPLVDRGLVRLRLGEHNVSDFTTCDLVVANPAVPAPWTNRYLRAAGAAGVPVTTEIQLVVERLPSRARVIGVTGTAGKSTTSAMIGAALERAGVDAVVGGNIGGSLLQSVAPADGPPRVGPATVVVLELSSFMLHWLGEHSAWSPGIAVVTNIAENHTDWHGSFAHYLRSKQHILRFQRPADRALLGPSVGDWAACTQGRPDVVEQPFDRPLGVPGGHNRANAAMALAAAHAAAPDADPNRLTDGISRFPGLPHRLQFAGEHAGVRYYNDSKSTTPEASARAVEAVAETTSAGTRGIHLIAGGYDKHADLAPLAGLAGRCAAVYTIGATGPTIAALARASGARVIESATLDAAITAAAAAAARGHAVLLSPGCASWDQFANYEERGRRFCDLVATVPASPSAHQGASP